MSLESNRDYVANPNGHVWAKDEDGNVDHFAMDAEMDFHNGPVCTKCGYSFCEHCGQRHPLPACCK